MPIPLHISPRLIPNVATLYNDVNRVFMEYIDNSLDSAEKFCDKEKNSYSRSIEITLKIEGDNHKGGRVIISDNCFGITNFTKVVQSIGNSDKKADFTTNGQFGYGIYSFMAFCSKLEITSKLEKENALYLPIEKNNLKPIGRKMFLSLILKKLKNLSMNQEQAYNYRSLINTHGNKLIFKN